MTGYWEVVEHQGANGSTERMRIEGGWLYRTRVREESGPNAKYSMAMTFVPDEQRKAVAA